MTTIKSFTSLEQSRKLAEILPLESADMAYYQWKGDGHLMSPNPFVLDGTEEKENGVFEYVPCWSLASLLGVLPQSVRLVGTPKDSYWYCECVNGNNQWYASFGSADNPIDACYEMIIRLNELKML